MECISSFPLSDETLGFVLDELADDDTLEHLRRCPFCANRLEEMRQLENLLQNRLRRAECPPPDRMADYLAGTLDPSQAQATGEHLQVCPHCRRELDMLEQFINPAQDGENYTVTPPNIIPLRLPERVYTASRVQIDGNLVLKGLYDTDGETEHDVRSGSARVFLESKSTLTGYLLTGQIIDTENDWSGAIAQLTWDNEPQQVVFLDETGEFEFEIPDLPSVTLRITTRNGITLIIQDIHFQP